MGKLGEAWQRVTILSKASSPGSVERGRERKGKFHVVLSFPNSHGQENTLAIDPFLPGNSYCLLVCLILCPENLDWQLSGWGLYTYGQTEILTCQLSEEVSTSFFWLFGGVALDLQRVVLFTSSPRTSLVPMGLFNML